MPRDTDSGEQANQILILTWSTVAGLVGGLAGLFVARSRGWAAAPTMLTGFVLGVALAYLGVALISSAAANAASTIYAPSGRGTPARRGYSHAESLVARARYAEAAAVYEQHAADDPRDPEPLLRLARLSRDRQADYEQAAAYLSRARDVAVDSGIRLLAARELVELYVRRMGQSDRALPELARIAEEFRDDPAAQWASRELARLKREIGPGA
jgi:tetratricopeptide (TPR) repeat protein